MEHSFSGNQMIPSQQNNSSEKKLERHNRFFEQEYIDSLQEDVIKDILTKILRKSSNEQALEKFIPFKEIAARQKTNEKILGSYYPDENIIELNTHELLHDEHKVTKALTLAVIVHEELHAVTSQKTVLNDTGMEGIRQIGLQTEHVDAITQGSFDKQWVMFNEGLTELIKDDVLEEYITRTGDRRDFVCKGYESGLEQSTYQTYLEERALVNDVFVKVGRLTGVPADTVREGFVQAYMSGMFVEDMQKTLYEIGGDILLTSMKDVPKTSLRQNFVETLTKYALTNASSQKDVEECAKECLVIYCTNYLRKNIAA